MKENNAKDSLTVGEEIFFIMNSCSAGINNVCSSETCEKCRWLHLYIEPRKIHSYEEIEYVMNSLGKSIFLNNKDAEEELKRRNKKISYNGL